MQSLIQLFPPFLIGFSRYFSNIFTEFCYFCNLRLLRQSAANRFDELNFYFIIHLFGQNQKLPKLAQYILCIRSNALVFFQFCTRLHTQPHKHSNLFEDITDKRGNDLSSVPKHTPHTTKNVLDTNRSHSTQNLSKAHQE